MKIGYTVLIFVIFISGLNSEAISSEMPLTEIILKVQDRLNQTRSIRSEFEQKNFIKSLGARTTSRGFLYIKKPEKIKIQYIKPQKQVFVSNENSIWIYTPKFKQVLHRKISITKQNINPIIFLSKKINLSKEFQISLVDTKMKNVKFWKKRKPLIIKLTPKKSNQKFSKIGVKFLKIHIDSSDYKIHVFEYTDSMDNNSKFEFLNLVENEDIEDNVFEFTIPANIDVIRY
tara:strand:+ start:579 stop:1271 length:693 start_codon:yes stop_codon:yes gene_type:complete